MICSAAANPSFVAIPLQAHEVQNSGYAPNTATTGLPQSVPSLNSLLQPMAFECFFICKDTGHLLEQFKLLIAYLAMNLMCCPNGNKLPQCIRTSCCQCLLDQVIQCNQILCPQLIPIHPMMMMEFGIQFLICLGQGIHTGQQLCMFHFWPPDRKLKPRLPRISARYSNFRGSIEGLYHPCFAPRRKSLWHLGRKKYAVSRVKFTPYYILQFCCQTHKSLKTINLHVWRLNCSNKSDFRSLTTDLS